VQCCPALAPNDGTDSVHEIFVLFGTLDEGDSTMFQQHKGSELTFVYAFVSCCDNNGVATATFAFVSYGTSVAMVTSKGGFTLS
jgi:hypothetical protein